MDDANSFADIDMIEVLPLIVIGVVQEAPNRTNAPIRSGGGTLSGADFLHKLLDCGNEKRIYGVLRMRTGTFKELCSWFRRRKLLSDSRNVAIEQQVAQFLWVINYNASISATAERFRISVEPTSR